MTASVEASVDSGESAEADGAEPVERIRREQTRRALRRLEAQGELTAEQRRAVERLAHRLVGALRGPAAGVVAASARDGSAAVRNDFQRE